jgi:hypothetical protein
MAQKRSGLEVPTDRDVEELAGYAALATAAAGVGYAIAFVVVKSGLWSAIFLLGGSALSLFVLLTVYRRFRSVQPTMALWALVFGAIGATGAAIHGGYDLANVLHPDLALTGFPNPVDPRGLLTFGASGIALLIGGFLVGRIPGLPAWARWLAFAAGLSLVATYVGRLIVLDATSPYVLGPALVAGVLSPVVYLALGVWLTRDASGPAGGRASGTAAVERAD